MLFSDTAFFLTFLPLLLAAHFLVVGLSTRGRGGSPRSVALANGVLLGGSLLFLTAALGRELVWVAVAAAGINHLIARGIARALDSQRPGNLHAELWLTVGVWGNLVLFGMGRAFVGAAEVVSPFGVANLLAPVGLAVFTLQALSYLVDVYRRDAIAATNPVQTGLYLLFFPLMVAGPVVPYREVREALVVRELRMGAFAYGVRRFVIGLVKVGLIAAPLARPVDTAFGATAGELGGGLAWLGLVCFSLQIYCVLSGYADMAIGLGRFFGFRFKENYRWPYAAQSLRDFWRRWNMSLIGWCRSYLNLQLERDRTTGDAGWWKGVALLVVVGIWHGPTSGLVLWALYHGALVLLEQTALRGVLPRLPSVARHGYLLLAVSVGWVFFRADTPTHAVVVLQALVGLGRVDSGIPDGLLTPSVWWAMVAAIAAAGRLPSSVSRWSVTLDAMTASLMMLVWATVVFCWRPVGRMVDLVMRRGRGTAH